MRVFDNFAKISSRENYWWLCNSWNSRKLISAKWGLFVREKQFFVKYFLIKTLRLKYLNLTLHSIKLPLSSRKKVTFGIQSKNRILPSQYPSRFHQTRFLVILWNISTANMHHFLNSFIKLCFHEIVFPRYFWFETRCFI